MASFRSVSLITILFSALTLGCSADSENGAKGAMIPPDYSLCKKGGIRVASPDSWEFVFDDSPSLYADREIGFKVSNFSTASLLVFKDRDTSTASVIDHFVDEFQIYSDPLLTNYQRSSSTIAGFKGEQITWTDTLAGESDLEFTVIKVKDDPDDAFVIFNLSDEDIAENEGRKAHFVQSIHID